MVKSWIVEFIIIAIILLNPWIVSAETGLGFFSGLQNFEINNYGYSQDSGELLWKFKTGDRIVGTPVFYDGVVYTGSEDHNLYALDANTGDEIWQFATETRLHTPAVSNGIVYIDSEELLFALDTKTGNIIWQFAGNNQIFNSIPIVENGIVYIKSKGTDSNIYALDANNGSIIWQFSNNNELENPSISNGFVYFDCKEGNFYALDAKTGSTIWQFPHKGDMIMSFSISDDIIYLAGTIDQQRRSNIYALDAMTGNKIWQVNIDIGFPMKPKITEDVLCIGGFSNNVIGLDTKTGSRLWQYNIGSGMPSTPNAIDGTVYFGCMYNNNFYALDAKSGKTIWQFTAGGYLPGWPVISDGIVYYHSADRNIYALDAKTGSKIWQFDVGSEYGNFQVINGVVYCGSSDHNVYAIGRPGYQSLSSDIPNPVTSAPSLSGSDEITSAFSVIQTPGTSPMEISFEDQSTGNPTIWLWDFGDGTTANIQNPTHLYASEGTYDISLTVSNGDAIALPQKKQVVVDNTNIQLYKQEPTQVNSNSLPDLTIPSLSVILNSGSNDLSVNLTIKNQGGKKSGKFAITYFLTESKTNHPFMDSRAREYLLGRDDVNGLEPGAVRDERSTKKLPIDNTQIPSGAYWFGIVIDSRNVIDESDEENNVLYELEPIKI